MTDLDRQLQWGQCGNAFFLMATRGRLLWLQKQICLYKSLQENLKFSLEYFPDVFLILVSSHYTTWSYFCKIIPIKSFLVPPLRSGFCLEPFQPLAASGTWTLWCVFHCIQINHFLQSRVSFFFMMSLCFALWRQLTQWTVKLWQLS